jgi:hypothetical protein
MPIVNKVLVPLLFATLLWPKASFCGPMHENVSVLMTLTGDLTGQYDLSGPLNQTIKAESSISGGCEANFLFRKVKSGGKTMLETWPAFSCPRDGQKISYKLHRSYLDPSMDVQKISVTSLDKKIKNVSIEFRDLSLQKGK